MNKVDFYKKIAKIQLELKAPKNQNNTFGNYKYRSCEDILEGVKPLLGDMVLTINDDVVMVGDRVYIKAVATISDGENEISNNGFAREALTKKGMDDSQITGSTSSYAKKYALSGLLLIDDNKDADSMDNTDKPVNKSKSNKPNSNELPWYNEPNYQADLEGVTAAIKDGTPPEEIIKEILTKFKVSNKYKDLIRSI